MRDPGRASFNAVMWTLSGLSVLLLVAPTIVIFIASFTDSQTLRFPPQGLSFRWYVDLLDSPEMINAALNSLKVALATAAISVALGVPAALHIAGSQAAWARALDGVFLSPLVLPMIAFGLALAMTVTTAGYPLSIYALIVGHVVVSVPFVLRTTVASLARLDPALLDSSASLGASRLYTFRRVTLPSVRPGILAGTFLAFMWSFDNIPVSLFVADARTEVLPIRMWQIIQDSLDVRAAAVSGVLIAATLVLIVAAERMAGLSRYLR
jgi:putative spermidine/putrescine transport system permease protein